MKKIIKNRTSVIFNFIIILVLMISCKNQQIEIANEINVTKTSNHKKFPLTNVFIIVPDGYKEVPTLPRFQKNSETYIQVLEIPGMGFKQKIVEIKETLLRLKSQGLIPYYEKEFLLNGLNAYFLWVPDSKANDQMILIYGTTDFLIFTTAVLPVNDEISRKEIFSSLCSIYYDHQISSTNILDSTYKLDVENTKFKLHSRISQITYYTINGEGDPINNLKKIIYLLCPYHL